MQLVNVCYLFLTITITAKCVYGENLRSLKNELEKKADRRLSKRDGTILVDNYPVESYAQPIVYKRVSKLRYKVPKPQYGPPKKNYGQPKPYNAPSKPTRAPKKKYRGKKLAPKHNPPYKTRRLKPKYGVPKKTQRHVYGPPKKVQQSYYRQEPAGFGEPPSEYSNDYHTVKPTRIEPPVDSYGAPLQAANNYHHTRHVHNEPNHYSNVFEPDHEFESFHNFDQDKNLDNTYAFSKNHPTIVKPDTTRFNDNNEDFGLNTYSDVFKYEPDFKEFTAKKKKVISNTDSKYANVPWKKRPEDDNEDQMLVGGQYAEPPARYVPKFQPSAPMYSGVEDFAPIGSSFDIESTGISPYVNYKNSNMAFSPQNLNDAFSISR